jgi:hypothetical protein
VAAEMDGEVGWGSNPNYQQLTAITNNVIAMVKSETGYELKKRPEIGRNSGYDIYP